MKTALIIIAILVILGLASFFVLGKMSQKGIAPGLVDGKLSKCSEKPNCVSSEYQDDAEHFIEPIIQQDIDTIKTMSTIVSTIQSMDGIVYIEKNNYIAAIFSSSLFGFVDDFEVRIDPDQGAIHFRSASRVGYSDAGVNKKRVETFKELYKQTL